MEAVRVLGVALLLSVVAGGCTGTNGGDTGSSGGTAGSSGLAPAGGVSITLAVPSAASAQSRLCNAGTFGSFTYELGLPAPEQTLRDGMDGARVTCRVNGDGSFDGTISGVETHNGLPASFSFSGVIHDKDVPAANQGTMTSSSPDTGPLTADVAGSPGCTFGPVSTLKQGAILTELDCPLVGSLEDDTAGCSAQGTIAFENCQGG